ncbi:hypothetical protein Ahy_B03g063030 [Arachis hypogaea]|uniref:Uncharacterized protein n=1 Tax=Arachis hypogaea TaxID=3818 RepID=A0A444ZW48_ARAHY|nr:hypothetical protein Ahy_B03g063030 [Arachis hypogaea]
MMSNIIHLLLAVTKIFIYYRCQFFEVRIPKLLAKFVDVASSSGGLNRNLHFKGYSACSNVMPVGSSSTVPVIAPETDLVVSPSFAINLNRNCDAVVGETGPLEEVAFTTPSSPAMVPVFGEVGVPDGVEDALHDDDDDVEPATIADDSDDETPWTTPAVCGGAFSSGINQYPPHFFSLDLDAMAP